MVTNLAIDQKLLEKALVVSGLKTKKETVNLALQEFKCFCCILKRKINAPAMD
ncbi:MAG: type II toxin-antitoxin system VapB family antitoxin [Proteobacteria bacterium]|nr:type II toxin-antitoxin system VapB family antitoxin [Pseudomonadota bacterium]MBU4010615.1 type II toxin-antitoxin system VapB family antitoxin [Pseudomonadota bacterium]MBU4037781.1 type II toxin-antitoxin system VapB family antitoxin [Pseudomonadota bacterium]